MSFTRSLAIWVDGYSMVFILCQTWCGQFSKTSVQVLHPNKRCPATSSPVLRAGRWTLHGESLSRTSLAIGKHAYVVAWRACVQWWQTSEVVWCCLWLNEERIYLTVTLGHYSPRVSKSRFFPILKWYKFGNVSDLNINRHIFSRNDISIYFPKCKTLRIQRWFHFPRVASKAPAPSSIDTTRSRMPLNRSSWWNQWKRSRFRQQTNIDVANPMVKPKENKNRKMIYKWWVFHI